MKKGTRRKQKTYTEKKVKKIDTELKSGGKCLE
jgi:hypothetical protein